MLRGQFYEALEGVEGAYCSDVLLEKRCEDKERKEEEAEEFSTFCASGS